MEKKLDAQTEFKRQTSQYSSYDKLLHFFSWQFRSVLFCFGQSHNKYNNNTNECIKDKVETKIPVFVQELPCLLGLSVGLGI